MKTTTKLLIIAKDDWPLEFIENSPLKNFIRRLLFADHKECHKCYEDRKGIKVS
jgi:hypothetical protein